MIVNVDIPLIDFGYGITRAVLSKRKPTHKSRDYPHSNIESNMWKNLPQTLRLQFPATQHLSGYEADNQIGQIVRGF